MVLTLYVLQTSISPIKKEIYSNFHLLYCLSDINHISVTSVCMFFVVKLYCLDIELRFY